MASSIKSIQPLLVDIRDAARMLSVSDRFLHSIPEAVLPRCRFGRAVRFRVRDVEALAEKLATGEVKLGPAKGQADSK